MWYALTLKLRSFSQPGRLSVLLSLVRWHDVHCMFHPHHKTAARWQIWLPCPQVHSFSLNVHAVNNTLWWSDHLLFHWESAGQVEPLLKVEKKIKMQLGACLQGRRITVTLFAFVFCLWTVEAQIYRSKWYRWETHSDSPTMAANVLIRQHKLGFDVLCHIITRASVQNLTREVKKQKKKPEESN